MATNEDEMQIVPASYAIPLAWKARIEAIAAADYSNPSVVIRRILADHFAKLDGADRKPAQKSPNGKAAKVTA